MIEKGISAPPKFNAQDVKSPILNRFLIELTDWLNSLRDVFPSVKTYSKAIDPTSVSANTTSEQTFTVKGLSTTDIVFANKPTHQAGLALTGCRVSAKDTLALTFMNTTAAGIDPASETYTIVAIRK